MSLDDIWAEPIVETTAGRNQETIASGTSRRALFLSDSEDENAGRRHVNSQPAPPARNNNAPRGLEKSQLDAIFAGLDDDDDLFGDVAPAVDIESLKRQADAKVAATRGTVPPTSSVSMGVGMNATRDKDKEGKGQKTRRVVPKLDEERLLGRDGFPRLMKEYKNFKVTGKGHENTDLEKLFRIYHSWTHKMFPKFQFRDTVERVERLCRSRRMTVNLKVWRDEANGVTPGVRHGVSQANDDGSDSERDSEDGPNDHSAPVPPSPSSSRPSTPVTRPGSAASTAPSVPSSATDIQDDMDIDALLREEEEIMREMDGAGKEGRSYRPSNVEDNEDALWAAAGEISDSILDMTSRRALTGSTSPGEADDEDMWDMFDTMENQRLPPKDSEENEKAATMATSEPVVTSPPDVSKQPTIGADNKRPRSKDSEENEQAATTVTSEPVVPSPPDVSDQPTIGADWDDMYE